MDVVKEEMVAVVPVGTPLTVQAGGTVPGINQLSASITVNFILSVA